MKNNFVRLAMACALLSFTSAAAMAAQTSGWYGAVDLGGNTLVVAGVNVTVKNRSGIVVARAQTDAKGEVRTSTLPPGDYQMEVDGPSFIRAMDALVPPRKHASEPSVSLGIGGMFGGGGSRHADHQGAGPTQGSHGGGGGGGAGIGVNVAVGDINGDGKPDDAVPSGGNAPMITFTATVNFSQPPGGRPTGTVNYFSETPYCRDSAGQGMRIGFTVPEGGGSVTFTSREWTGEVR